MTLIIENSCNSMKHFEQSENFHRWIKNRFLRGLTFLQSYMLSAAPSSGLLVAAITTTGRPDSRVTRPSMQVRSWFKVDSACGVNMMEWNWAIGAKGKRYTCIHPCPHLLVATSQSQGITGASTEGIDLRQHLTWLLRSMAQGTGLPGY